MRAYKRPYYHYLRNFLYSKCAIVLTVTLVISNTVKVKFKLHFG
jgi:hypothetical protein